MIVNITLVFIQNTKLTFRCPNQYYINKRMTAAFVLFRVRYEEIINTLQQPNFILISLLSQVKPIICGFL